MAMLESQVAHRHSEERLASIRHHRRVVTGQFLGFTLNVGCYGLAAWLASQGMNGGAIAAVITAALSTIGLFAASGKNREQSKP
jgi:hypothetical protein